MFANTKSSSLEQFFSMELLSNYSITPLKGGLSGGNVLPFPKDFFPQIKYAGCVRCEAKACISKAIIISFGLVSTFPLVLFAQLPSRNRWLPIIILKSIGEILQFLAAGALHTCTSAVGTESYHKFGNQWEQCSHLHTFR